MKEPIWEYSFPKLQDQNIEPIISFLGDEDAAVEWEKDEKPVDLFLHTNTYEAFKKEQSLFLFGRRGTGKTAIMRMFQHEIRSGMIKNYTYAWRVNSEEAFGEIIRHLGDKIANFDLAMINDLAEKWRWIFEVSAMAGVVHKHYHDAEHDKNYECIYKYLKRNSMIKKSSQGELKFAKNPMEKIVNVIEEALSSLEDDYKEAAAANLITKIVKNLKTKDFEEAQKALYHYVSKNNRCVIFIDSIEHYNINDNISQAVTTALIKATYDTYVNSSKSGLHVKVAFPSEIYSYLIPLNKDKIETKNLFILWSFKDLVCLLAKRYYYMCTNTLLREKLNHCIYDRLYEFEFVKKFLYELLPETVVTESGFEMDTLAYIIRHTQKKPRQIIQLMNIVLSYAAKVNGETPIRISGSSIVNGVHARLDILAKGSLDAYQQIYPNITKVIQKSFTNAKCYFSHSDFDKYIKESNSLWKQDQLTKYDVQSLILGTGAVGVVKHKSRVRNKEIWETAFEYQIKGILEANNNVREYAIHPMFYNFFECQVDNNVIIYPQPQEQEELEYLKKEGILLV